MPRGSNQGIDFNIVTYGGVIFLAEGRSEQGLLSRYCSIRNYTDAHIFNICGENSLSLVLASLRGSIGSIRPRSLGLVLDANADASAAQKRIEGALSAHGFHYHHSKVDPVGVFEGTELRIGVFLSPGGGLGGRIEDLILMELEQRPHWSCVAELAACLGPLGTVDTKAMVQIGISAIPGAGGLCGSGSAFERGLLDPTHAAYNGIAALVDRLCGP